jgi:tripartite-type tricarboxylate transporter receptor subunit TctC
MSGGVAMKRIGKQVFAAGMWCAAVACGSYAAPPAGGDTAAGYPARPIRIVVPSTPAGASDFLARLIAPRLTEAWHQQVVVDNRPGAGGIIGSEIVSHATPDGHTLLIVATGYAVNPFLYARLPYDTVKDFAPVTVLVSSTHVLVAHPSLPAASIKELLSIAKASPGQLTYGHSGTGTGGHLSVELFKKMAGLDMVGVPYKGAGAATAAVLSGQVQMLFTQVAPALPHVRSGKLRALATTSLARSPELPDVPTLAESGLPGFQVDAWLGMLAPGKTPPDVIAKLRAEIAKILHAPDVKSRLAVLGFEPVGNTPAQFAAFIRSEMDKWSKLIKDAGIKAGQSY